MSIPIPIPQFAVPREEKVEELSSFGQDLISKLTLECLMNDKQYSKYISRNNIASQKDKKFYKKRIYDLTKKILHNEEIQIQNPDVIHTFEIFAKTCIEYFKVLDKTDILQEEYSELSLPTLETILPNVGVETEIELMTTESQEKIDTLMMRTIKIIEQPTQIERLVKRTALKKDKPPIPPPKKKEIDLKNPALKNKGICEKKNLRNKYDGKNTENTENAENAENTENTKVAKVEIANS